MSLVLTHIKFRFNLHEVRFKPCKVKFNPCEVRFNSHEVRFNPFQVRFISHKVRFKPHKVVQDGQQHVQVEDWSKLSSVWFLLQVSILNR